MTLVRINISNVITKATHIPTLRAATPYDTAPQHLVLSRFDKPHVPLPLVSNTLVCMEH